MPTLKQLTPWAIVGLMVLVGIYYFYKPQAIEETNCKTEEITAESLKKLDYPGEIDSETIRLVNEETPLCKDLCLEELKNTNSDLGAWLITEETRKLCNQVGVALHD